MNNEQEDKLFGLLLTHYEEAQYIEGNLIAARENLGEQFRKEVMQELKKCLGDEFGIHKGAKITTKWAQIWVSLTDRDKSPVYFGLESFSGRGHNPVLFVGTFVGDDVSGGYVKKWKIEDSTRNWADTQNIPDFRGHKLAMTNGKLISELHVNRKFREECVVYVASYFRDYIKQYGGQVEKYLKSIQAKESSE